MGTSKRTLPATTKVTVSARDPLFRQLFRKTIAGWAWFEVDDAVDRSNDSQDVGPLQASRMWVTQAENNVIDRLVEAGLVAPLNNGGYENKVLDQIVVNLVVPNNLAFTDQIHTRVMLTDTVEATTVGNTILLSRGLIDSLPSEEAIASIIAMELAHIAMGHHIDTRYAFNDRLLQCIIRH